MVIFRDLNSWRDIMKALFAKEDQKHLSFDLFEDSMPCIQVLKSH